MGGDKTNCDSTDNCGQWNWALPESVFPQLHAAALDIGTCVGFKKAPPPPPTPSPPPSPPKSFCDFCNESGLECCGDGGVHTVCYNGEYDECCDSPVPSGIDDPVKLVCAKDQQCEPGCFPHAHNGTRNASI